MKSRREATKVPTILRVAAAILIASSSCGVVARAATLTSVGGTFKLLIDLTASPDLPDGSSITVYTNANTYDSASSNNSGYSTTSTIARGKRNLIVLLPYKWLVGSKTDQVTISVNVSGYAGEGSDSSNFSKTISLPADGATTTVRLSGTI